jgi:Protein of unknown function (DUF1761)
MRDNMEIVNVLVAAIAAFAFGAVWYMTMSKPWMAAAEIKIGPDGRPANSNDKMPFVIGLIGMILAAGMMRHIFNMAGIDTLGEGVTAGLGIGAFSVMPWVAMNYAFGQRKFMLTLIDGVNVIIGCGIIGAVLMAF